jgi:hypothetical protein
MSNELRQNVPDRNAVPLQESPLQNVHPPNVVPSVPAIDVCVKHHRVSSGTILARTSKSQLKLHDHDIRHLRVDEKNRLLPPLQKRPLQREGSPKMILRGICSWKILTKRLNSMRLTMSLPKMPMVKRMMVKMASHDAADVDDDVGAVVLLSNLRRRMTVIFLNPQKRNPATPPKTTTKTTMRLKPSQ